MGLRQYPGSPIWHFQCRVSGKKWSRSTGETDKRKALAKVPQLKALAELHKSQPEKSLKFSRALVAEVNRIETDVSFRAAKRADNCLHNFLKWLGRDILLEKIDTRLLEQYQRRRLQEAAAATVTRELYTLLTLLRQNGFTVRKPSHKPGRHTEQRDFKDEELQRFFAACEDETHKTLYLLLLATGARPAEVIPSNRSTHTALLKKELDQAAGTVTIRTAKMKLGQKQKVRVIRVPEEVMRLLLVQAERMEGPHVFPPGALSKKFDRILKLAKIPKIDELGCKLTAHSFRHTFATRQAEAVNNNPLLLKDILGHSQLAMTDRYCHAHGNAAVIDVAGLMGVGVSGGCESEQKKTGEEPPDSSKSSNVSAM